MSNYSREVLSGSTDGMPVLIAAVAIASGTLIHTAIAGVAGIDEIYLSVTNTDTVDRLLTIGWGGVTDPDNLVCKSVLIPAKSGPTPIINGLNLRNGLLVKASCDAANIMLLTGYVNRIS